MPRVFGRFGFEDGDGEEEGGLKREDVGLEGSGVARIRYASSRSAMLVARGPITPLEVAKLLVGRMETRPWVGFRP